MQTNREFFNLYNHGFVRVAVGIPEVRVADVEFNAAATIALMHQAVDRHAALVLFPELGLTAYSCDDLFHQQPLIIGAIEALHKVLEASKSLNLVTIIGLPLQIDSSLFNCAVIVCQGSIMGVVPKTFLPNYREFYELRQFASAVAANRNTISLCGQSAIPFGTSLIFRADNKPNFCFFVEICEDLWVPIPPSSHAALAGATVLLNLSASNITTGKYDYRHSLVANQSARCLSAYLYTSAGTGESTTDLAWDGHAIIYENGALVAESRRFHNGSQLLSADVDLDRLTQERMRQNSFSQSVHFYRDNIHQFREILFKTDLPVKEQLLCQRLYDRFPYIPSDPKTRNDHCNEIFNIQTQSLVKRLKHTGIQKIVIGVSGGLDSALALMVAARAMDTLQLPRKQILAYTMPGFATSDRTLANANAIMLAMGCTAHEIDIRPGCKKMLQVLNHPYMHGKPVYDVTFENVQAGERTSYLFRFANYHKALVLGTADLSELALGWCTYGVGDQMSHYAINASVPKTLIKFLIRWIIDTEQFRQEINTILLSILETRISPELLPGETRNGRPAQHTEAIIGPYELQDFNLYYTTRFGYLPTKIAFLAYCSWHDRTRGNWPDPTENGRNQYTIGEIKHWLQVFAYRFFQENQFKRSCIPNSPKVGSGGSLSPRGDYRAPSDSEATLWVNNIKSIPDIRS
ncbi:NAD+ synthase (glutamine-hydrolysing) [Nitrosomonas marina]|uniref:Glutamine-dependent NAD(+) synthetase n=1 Tax=Nitrosomonas marina TaxID=917 RepID=A0A1H9Y1Z2_9PROT|nr:NAD(+) synthase [Nitrosomonas marina]SES62836.1 NAD+ synthase (glutamine-hydrolysing) [Nitrosomonas marina]